MKNGKNTNSTKLIKQKVTGTSPFPANSDLPTNINIPTNHADIVNVLCRSDGINIISFFTRTPGVNVEECRISLNTQVLKVLINTVCKSINYYPTPEKSTPLKDSK